MSTKFYSTLALITLCINSSSLFGYTFLNQTDEEIAFTIQEAYRPPAEQPGDLADPVIINESPVEFTVAPKSSITVDLEPCILIYLTMKTVIKNGQTIIGMLTKNAWFEPPHRKKSINDWGTCVHTALPTSAIPYDITLETIYPEKPSQQ